MGMRETEEFVISIQWICDKLSFVRFIFCLTLDPSSELSCYAIRNFPRFRWQKRVATNDNIGEWGTFDTKIRKILIITTSILGRYSDFHERNISLSRRISCERKRNFLSKFTSRCCCRNCLSFDCIVVSQFTRIRRIYSRTFPTKSRSINTVFPMKSLNLPNRSLKLWLFFFEFSYFRFESVQINCYTLTWYSKNSRNSEFNFFFSIYWFAAISR